MLKVRLFQKLIRSFLLLFLSGPMGGQMRRRLQGMAEVTGWPDVHVHFRDSIYLISEPEANNKILWIMLYGGGRQGWSGAKAIYSGNGAHCFWLRNFFGKE